MLHGRTEEVGNKIFRGDTSTVERRKDEIVDALSTVGVKIPKRTAKSRVARAVLVNILTNNQLNSFRRAVKFTIGGNYTDQKFKDFA